MSRLALGAAFVLFAMAAEAQQAPARELLGHGLGLVGEGAALGSGAASGFWNPATGHLPAGERARIAAAALNAPIDLALAAQIAHVAVALPSWGTLSVSVAHAAVSDLVRTDTDPQSIGGDIPYRTVAVSTGLSRRVLPNVVAGAAVRWRWGHANNERASVLATDLGVVADGLTRFDGRVAISTFLLTPSAGDAPVIAAAADARIASADSIRFARAGVAASRTRGAITEWYPFVEGHYARISLRAGPVFSSGYGNRDRRFRLGLVLRQQSFSIGVAREDNAGGLSPSYQLSVVRVIR